MGDGAADRADLLDLAAGLHHGVGSAGLGQAVGVDVAGIREHLAELADPRFRRAVAAGHAPAQRTHVPAMAVREVQDAVCHHRRHPDAGGAVARAISSTRSISPRRSEEHTSELQSLMRISYAVFCLKKKHTKS